VRFDPTNVAEPAPIAAVAAAADPKEVEDVDDKDADDAADATDAKWPADAAAEDVECACLVGDMIASGGRQTAGPT
jgi:hypothetical protein